MHYFQNQFTRLGEKLRERRMRNNRLRYLHNLLLLSDTDLAKLDVSRAEINGHLRRLHLGATTVVPR